MAVRFSQVLLWVRVAVLAASLLAGVQLGRKLR